MPKKKKGSAQPRKTAESVDVLVTRGPDITPEGRMTHWWELWQSTVTGQYKTYLCYNTKLALLRQRRAAKAKPKDAEPDTKSRRRTAGASDELEGFGSAESTTDDEMVEDGYVDYIERLPYLDRMLQNRCDMGQDTPPWWEPGFRNVMVAVDMLEA